MTAAQKTAKLKFKQAIAYRQKTGVSLKEAFAHIYGKKVGAVKKKIIDVLKISDIKPGIEIINNNNPQWGSYKVDRKYDKGIWEISNNRGSRILDEAEAKFWKKLPSKLTFLSGQKKVGALPVGFIGSIENATYKILGISIGFKKEIDKETGLYIIQVLDLSNNKKIIPISNNSDSKEVAYDLTEYIKYYTNTPTNIKSYGVLKKLEKLVPKIKKEVQNLNKKSTIMPIKNKVVKKKAAPKKKVAKKVVRKVVKKKAAPKKKVAKKKLTRKDYDKRFQADKPGKRTSASGNTYYEYRGNRSDKGKLLGIGNITIDKYKKVQNDVIALEKALNRNLEQMKQIQYKTPFWKQRFKISNAKLKSYIKELKTHGKELKKII